MFVREGDSPLKSKVTVGIALINRDTLTVLVAVGER